MDGGDETVEGSIGEIDERGWFEKFRLQEQRMAPRWGHHVNARVQRGAGVLTPTPGLRDRGDRFQGPIPKLHLVAGRGDRPDVLGVPATEVATPVFEDRALLDGVGVVRVEEQQTVFGIVLDGIDRGLHEHHLAHFQDAPAQFQGRGVLGLLNIQKELEKCMIKHYLKELL